jgi:hypothetical protein
LRQKIIRLIAQPERKWLNFNHRRPPPPPPTIAAHALYENNGACACVGGAALAWRTAHAITFLPPTACNYFIVHDAEIKFLLLLSNAAACRRYNLKIQIALPLHVAQLYRLYKLRLSNASTSLAELLYCVDYFVHRSGAARCMQHKRMRVKGGFVNGGASILSISGREALMYLRSEYMKCFYI